MKHGKIRAAALLAAAVLCICSGCKDKGIEPPEEYTIGEETVAALVPEEGAQLTAADETSYTYEGLTSGGDTVSAYAGQLTAEESGFSIVDDELAQREAPDYTAAEGSLRLAKNSATEGQVVTLLVTWTENACTVLLEQAEGAVKEAEKESQSMSMLEAVDYIKSLSPADLGLSGATMEDYRVYAIDGVVFVDDRPCLRLNVYSVDNPQQANEIMGSYLMTGDGRHLYRLDNKTGMVEELDSF